MLVNGISDGAVRYISFVCVNFSALDHLQMSVELPSIRKLRLHGCIFPMDFNVQRIINRSGAVNALGELHLYRNLGGVSGKTGDAELLNLILPNEATQIRHICDLHLDGSDLTDMFSAKLFEVRIEYPTQLDVLFRLSSTIPPFSACDKPISPFASTSISLVLLSSISQQPMHLTECHTV